MRKEKTNNIKLGLFITIGFVLFTYAIYNIGSRQNLFGSSFKLNTDFKNVNGLQVGNNVRFAGINVGSIDEISILNDSTIRVTMVITQDVKGHIKKDAKTSISSDGLVGNKIINITPGITSKVPAESNDVLQSIDVTEAGDVMSTLGQTTNNISLLTEKLITVVDNLSNGSGSVPMLLNDKKTANEIQNILLNLSKTSAALANITTELKQEVQQTKNGSGALGYLMTDTLMRHNITSITHQIDTSLSQHTAPIMTSLQTSSKELSEVTKGLKLAIDQLNYHEGLLHQVMADSSVSKDIKTSLQNLNEGTAKFNELMEALKHNFLVRGFFKKEEDAKKKKEGENKK